MIVKFENIKLDVHPNKEHEWVLETSLVAKGYGIDSDHVKKAMQRRKEDLIEGKHWVKGGDNSSLPLKKNAQPNQIFWTKNGVVRLGFFLRCEKAKVFRDWAEDLIINKMKGNNILDEHIEKDEKNKHALSEQEMEKRLGQEGFTLSKTEKIHNIKMYKTISNFFETRGITLKNELIIEVSNEAKSISQKEGYPVLFLPSNRFGKVNLYHEDTIQSAYFMLTDNWIH